MTPAMLFMVLSALAAAPSAQADEFRCPEGAKDSGERPGMVVRWCEVTKDGRLLYHGPVWRWHRNGQLEGREYYVFGDAEGEWPSWYANGKPSSLGTFKKGQKYGPWKYWAEDGHLTSEVTYSSSGASSVEYFPSGKKLATGAFKDGAKLGLWVAFNEDGTEKARCNFGDGLFALPTNKGCKFIANELNPKGFSRPVPRATVTPDGIAGIRIGPQTFAFTTPLEWTADATAGAEDGVPLVFFPKGTGWRSAGRNMYIRPLFKDGKAMKAVMESEKASFAGNVAEYHEAPLKTGKLSSGRGYVSKTIDYKPVMQTDSPFGIVQNNTIREAVAYLDASPEVVLIAVLACETEEQMKGSLPAFTSLIESLSAK